MFVYLFRGTYINNLSGVILRSKCSSLNGQFSGLNFVFSCRFWDTPVVKSSSRELCYIILAGICLGYLCTFSLIAKPHIIYCYLQRLGIGLSPAMSYSALVTKVNYSLHFLIVICIHLPMLIMLIVVGVFLCDKLHCSVLFKPLKVQNKFFDIFKLALVNFKVFFPKLQV